MNKNCFLSRLQPYAIAVLRIVTAYLFILHGTSKLLGFPNAAMALSEFYNIYALAGVLEIIGGILLILGLYTRFVAFLLSGQMAVAYFMSHASTGNSLYPLMNGGEAAVLFCFIFLTLVFTGAGAFSLDKARAANN